MSDRLAELDGLYDEIYACYRRSDPLLVRRQTVPEALDSRVILVGQAPGRDTQRLSGLPYCLPPPESPTLSRGGRVLDAFLSRFGYTIHPEGRGQYAYHTDLAHYFPGRKTHGTGDAKPVRAEVVRSRRWLETELRLIEPAVVIALGKEPATAFLGRYAGRSVNRLTDVAATPIQCRVPGRDVQLIAVHHPSGAFQHPSSRETYESAAGALCEILGSPELRAAELVRHGL
jgi:uracil-DNA glycosylase family 4